MAELVQIVGVTHNPVLPGIFERSLDVEPAVRAARENFELMRIKLAEARPDVIVMAAGDHLNQFFMGNMPPFLIGKAPRATGPFLHEIRDHGLCTYDIDVDVDLARHLLNDMINRGFDMAYSDEFNIDHAFTMPLSYIRPEKDLPVVPIFTNVMAPPIATAQRFYDLGRAVAESIRAWSASRRVAVITSGHMANSVGGMRMLERRDKPELEFDLKMMDLLEKGDSHALVEAAAWDNLIVAGNGTAGFLDFVFATGVADGAAPDYRDLNSTRVTTASFFITWDRWKERA